MKKSLLTLMILISLKCFEAFITMMFVCNESVSSGYIKENSNESNPNEEDSFESTMFLENYWNNIQGYLYVYI